MKSVQIGNHQIGPGHPVYIIAEIGGNFKNLEQGKQEIDMAVEAGAHAAKVQTFRAETIVNKDSCFENIAGGANQFDLFKELELSEEDHKALFDYATKKGLDFFSTPSFYDDCELLERLGVPAYKLGSDDLTNLPFVEHVASLKKPLILSTGMATLQEAAEAVEACRKVGNEQVIVLHCVSSYPVKDYADLNLKAIQTLQKELNVPIGFSDHTPGTFAAGLAVMMGACVIEKHCTLDKALDTPDSFFSADPGELKEMCENIRLAEKAIGDGVKQPTKEEAENKRQVRKSVIAKNNIAKGSEIQEKDLIIKRPGLGVEPKRWKELIGKKAARDFKADEMIEWEGVQA